MRTETSYTVMILVIQLCLLCLCSVEAIRFHLGPNQKKCLKEEIHKNVLVTGEYEAGEAPGQKTDIHITDSKGHTLYKKEDISKGMFAFTTEEYDMFEVCMESKMPQGGHGPEREVSLLMKHGIEAKSYDEIPEVTSNLTKEIIENNFITIAKAEKLKPLEVELKRLEDLSEAIVNDFAYMRHREEEMRDTNESTHSRVLYFSIFSMCCLLGLATWQVLYLRRFFKAKKLIE